jgi:hypothetical protein
MAEESATVPRRYEKMRDKFKKEGMSEEAAKAKAARIYNATKKKGEPKLSPKHKKKGGKK